MNAIDPAVIDRLLAANAGRSRMDRDLKIGGMIALFIAPGLAVLGWFLAALEKQLLGVMFGVSILVACVGTGLLVAGKVSERWYKQD